MHFLKIMCKLSIFIVIQFSKFIQFHFVILHISYLFTTYLQIAIYIIFYVMQSKTIHIINNHIKIEDQLFWRLLLQEREKKNKKTQESTNKI